MTMSRAIPAEPALRGSSRVVVPFTGPPLETSKCEHTRVPVNSKELSATTHVLTLRETFQIARGAADEETVVAATLERDGIVAYGEGAPVDYWGETPAGIVDAIESEGLALLGDDLFAGAAIHGRLAAWDGPQGAKMALDGLVHDWLGKRLGQPLWRVLGTDRVTPPTSYTIGIDSVEGTADKVRRAPGYEVYKIKVGGPGDLERLRAVRAETAARLRIDGNEGWTLETARELTPELIALGVEFVEQPFPATDIESFVEYRQLPERLPVLIDEGCRDLASIADDRDVRGRHRDQARQVRRHPRGAAHGPRGARARPGDHVRLHDRVRAGDRAGGAARLAGRLHRPRRPPADLQRAVHRARARRRATGALRRARARRGAGAWLTGSRCSPAASSSSSHAKTAHGILRYGTREVVCVVDAPSAGRGRL